MLKVIKTDHAPAAIGTYSQAVQVGDLLFVSGQIGMNPESGELVAEDFEHQSERAFNNLKAIVDAAGSSLSNIVKLNISVTSMSNFQIFNNVMLKFFKEPYPARAVVEVAALPKAALVEIEAVVSLHD